MNATNALKKYIFNSIRQDKWVRNVKKYSYSTEVDWHNIDETITFSERVGSDNKTYTTLTLRDNKRNEQSVNLRILGIGKFKLFLIKLYLFFKSDDYNKLQRLRLDEYEKTKLEEIALKSIKENKAIHRDSQIDNLGIK